MWLKAKLKNIEKGVRENLINPRRVLGKQKFFCVGLNKTGTTSLKKAFEDLGFLVGNQRKAEHLSEYYFKGNFAPIVRYCKSAQVFQDVPFSYPGTYRHLDAAFPGSKFILTIRKNPEIWYNSVVRFHAKLFGGGVIPDAQRLANARYVRKGWMLENVLSLYGTSVENPYDKDAMIHHYKKHNKEVVSYFASRTHDLLVVDLSLDSAYPSFCRFVGAPSPLYDRFPWENKTDDVILRYDTGN